MAFYHGASQWHFFNNSHFSTKNFTKIYSSSETNDKRHQFHFRVARYSPSKCYDCIELMKVLIPHFSRKMSDLLHCAMHTTFSYDLQDKIRIIFPFSIHIYVLEVVHATSVFLENYYTRSYEAHSILFKYSDISNIRHGSNIFTTDQKERLSQL